MTRFNVRLTLRPVPWRFALVYRLRGMRPPTSSTSHDSAALVPYLFRGFHRRHAEAHGYFWLPCVLCRKPFGGHEIAGSIPDPTGPTTMYVGICPACTPTKNCLD